MNILEFQMGKNKLGKKKSVSKFQELSIERG